MDTVKAPFTSGTGGTALDDHDPAEPVFLPLVMEERDRLKEIFRDPAFVKAWRNLRSLKPSLLFGVTPATLAMPTGPQLANNRLHEMRGWEMFSAALLNQSKEPVLKKKTVLEEFPDAGTIEGEVLRTASAVPVPQKIPGQPQSSGQPVSGFPRPPITKPRNRR